jgi:MYXO-CTERM domain-containing protein
MIRRAIPLLPALLLLSSPARAADAIVVGEAKLDRPTVTALGVQLLITGDDDFDAKVDVRYRKIGGAWANAAPLFRVHPETVKGRTVPTQFAGSIVDLAPNTTYEIELHVVDPDGVDTTKTVTGKTRAVPADPVMPRAVKVTDTATLKTALSSAKAGDVITLGKGTYTGPFSISASGAAGNPIVIRGEDRDGVILDGADCAACNVLEIYGSYVHVEKLTLQNANRALRWQTAGAQGNVLRRVRVKNVTLGTGAKAGQLDFYVCDNVFEGRLKWPATYPDDGGAHASDDGILLSGSGHVMCHNTVSGFGDALNSAEDGARSIDYYGNDVLFTYDDGLEFDGVEGNARAWRNRFTNTYQTMSFQPVFGGPVYAMRNVLVNVRNEPLKLHALGGTPPQEPSGVLIYHNTFVKFSHAFQLSTPNVVHHYRVMNNLWVGNPTDGKTVEWDTPIDFMTGVVDFNGYWPDGKFQFGYGATGVTYTNFAAVQAAGRYEKNGTLLEADTFESGLKAPTDYKPLLAPADVRLKSTSKAVDKGTPLVGINDGFKGAAPDLGAIESGCPLPLYGPRPEGTDESNLDVSCGAPVMPPGDAGPDGSVTTDSGTPTTDTGVVLDDAGNPIPTPDAGGENNATGTDDSGGCGCHTTNNANGGIVALLALAALISRRRGT